MSPTKGAGDEIDASGARRAPWLGHAVGDGPTELAIEQGKLSIKSSVTGLIVLAISLAFFVIYVLEVYAIKPDVAEAKSPVVRAAPVPATPKRPPLEAGGGDGPAP